MTSEIFSTAERPKPLVLHFQNETRLVVHPENNDLFMISVREAAQACQVLQNQREWNEEWTEYFKRFIARIYEWAMKHSNRVQKTLVAPAMRGMEVFVVTNSKYYDTEFDDEVTNLDLELAQEFPKCRAHVMQAPDDSQEALQSLCPTARAILVYGK